MKTLFKCDKCGKEFNSRNSCHEHERLCGIPDSKRWTLVRLELRLRFNDIVHIDRTAVVVGEGDPDVIVEGIGITYKSRTWHWVGEPQYYKNPYDGKFEDTIVYIEYVDGHMSEEAALESLKSGAKHAISEEIACRRTGIRLLMDLSAMIGNLTIEKEDNNGKR